MEVIENENLIGSINGTIFGGARLATGKKGLALHTNGQDQYVDFGYQGDTCLGSFVSCTQGWVTTFWIQMGNDDFGVIVDTVAQGAVSIRKTVLPGMAIPMLKIRRPNGRLIFNMEIAIRR